MGPLASSICEIWACLQLVLAYVASLSGVTINTPIALMPVRTTQAENPELASPTAVGNAILVMEDAFTPKQCKRLLSASMRRVLRFLRPESIDEQRRNEQRYNQIHGGEI